MNLLSWILLLAVIIGLIAAVIYTVGHRGGCTCGSKACSACPKRNNGCKK